VLLLILTMKQARQALVVAVLGAFATVGSASCDKGPMQQTGEKLDRATDQDKLIGKGPLEKAGQSIDGTMNDIKK